MLRRWRRKGSDPGGADRPRRGSGGRDGLEGGPGARPGERVGPYRIVEELGRGGMGVVYVAEDARLGRRVALKTLGMASSPDAHRRLWREARAAARLNHPGICQVYDVEELDGELWVAMELLEGEGLDASLGRERLGVDRAIQIGLDVLEPLGFLHARGLVHRDLKPSNIFLTPLGLKLLDFGLARLVHPGSDGPDAADARLTQTGAILGTPRYMAPEQWRARDVGPRSDLFSCGAILYEMLSGRYAFEGDNAIDIFHACAHEQPPPLTGAPGIDAVDAVVRRALAKDPAERFESAGDMAEALLAARERMRALETPGGASRPERPVETVRRFIALPFRVLRPDPEIDFLATSLPEAIGTSLSGLRYLVIRSTQLATGLIAGPDGAATAGPDGAGTPGSDAGLAVGAEEGRVPHRERSPRVGRAPGSTATIDLKKLAAEVEVDYALAGTLLRGGPRVRLNAQLLQVPSGTVVWSLQEDAPIEDLFQLQDHLTSRIVEGIAIPLSPAEAERLRPDTPVNAKAYEFYLRGLHLVAGVETETDLLSIRDLLRGAVDADPSFAPAWAMYGRACRIIAKYDVDDVEVHQRLAREAFDRAFEADPDSPIAHNFYTYYQLEELADSRGAMLRLLDRVSQGTADANLWAGLVPACRFLGLYGASLAAHERAHTLDPRLETGVELTHFQLGEHELVVDRSEGLLKASAMATAGREEEAVELLMTSPGAEFEGLRRFFVGSLLAALQGRGEECERRIRKILGRGLWDPEAAYHFARVAGRAGLIELGVELVERGIERGFYSVHALEHDPWLAGLQGEPRYVAALERAREGHRQAAEAFRETGGEKLLGVEETLLAEKG